MTTNLTESTATSVQDALRTGRQRAVILVGQLERNQGLPTFTGRMTLEQFTDLTVVHNRKWAEDAGESLDVVTQREIIDAHANGLASFILQGLVDATTCRTREDKFEQSFIDQLEIIQDRIGRSAHYGVPQVTLVLAGQPEVRLVKENEEVIAARLFLPSGRLFVVADGQHRREASRRVREFLNAVIGNRRIPRSVKFYPPEDAPLSSEELEAWVAVQETFRTWTLISYEAHIGLSVDQARQMFTNYNCNVKPVKKELNLAFDQSNPINVFGKTWVLEQLAIAEDGSKRPLFDLRQIAAINGFLFLGKTTIKSAPYNAEVMLPIAREFWTTVLQSGDWKREGTLLREPAILKGLAKSWFYVFVAKRNNQFPKAEKLRAYVRRTQFDKEWMESVPGLAAHTVPADTALGFRFSPAHNDIVAKAVAHALA